MSKKAILLINVGTPDHANKKSVGRYLREFLSDKRVIDLPSLLRWPLVNLFILPLRIKKSTLAYQKIWQDGGSPLLIYMQRLSAALSRVLGPEYQVEFGMRYGEPSIQTALAKLKDSNDLTVVPLYPQYSSAATGSAIEKTLKLLTNDWNIPALNVIRDFYNYPDFIAAYADVISNHINGKAIDLVLFSYHGLPGRHINKSQCHAVCDHQAACPAISDENHFCYRAQCYATSQLIANQLNLRPQQFHVSFQSRLGRTPWIKPYTDLLLPELIAKGVKHIAIVSPSFVADCLETVEEINIRLREQWLALGGQSFTFIPCLNDSAPWVNALARLITG